jgi:HPt (histidine-containing phosphotransfer) domain-containing protein
LRGSDGLSRAGDELATAAHTLAGSAGLFGFERLSAVGRRFERAVQSGAVDVPVLAAALSGALEATLQAIHDRSPTAVEA